MSELNKLQPDMLGTAFKQEFQQVKDRVNELGNDTGAMATNVSGLFREIAWLKLKQPAEDRVDDGVLFADDMNGTRFGFELNEVESQKIKIRDGEMLMIEDVEIPHFATDEVVVNQAYSTAGNGGRKLVRLQSGNQYVAVKNGTTNYLIYKSEDGWMTNGVLFATLAEPSNSPDIALATDGSKVFVILVAGSTAVKMYSYTEDGARDPVKALDSSQTAIGRISLAIDPTNGHLHAAWASKNATYPNSFNIRYTKSTDGGVTWSTVEQKTAHNASSIHGTEPCIVVVNSTPVILYSFQTNGANNIFAMVGSSTANRTVHNGAVHVQSSPSGVVDKDGVIHVAWQGVDAEVSPDNYIRYSKSVDGGITWSPMKRFRLGKDASISTNSKGHIFITYNSYSGCYFIKSIDDGVNWSEPYRRITGSGSSSLDDSSLNFTIPLTIHGSVNSVVFNGEWIEIIEEPRTSATAVYDIPSTDFVGAFVKKEGAVTATAFLNDAPMDSTLDGDEFKFETMDLLPSAVPAKLRLELTRPNTTGEENDAITRILGGRS